MLLYIIILTNIYIKSTINSCSSLVRLTDLTNFKSLTFRTELGFKSENLFRMCSVVTNLVVSLKFLFNPLCYYAVSLWTETERLRSHPDLFFSVALRKTVVQAATWPLRNAPAKVRRELVETCNGLGKSLDLFPTADLIDEVYRHLKTWTFLAFIDTLFYVF